MKLNWKEIRDRIAHTEEMLQADSSLKDEQEVLDERALRFKEQEQQDHEDGQEMVMFTRGSSNYALPVRDISEIRTIRTIAEIPATSAVIKGLINVRGRIVTVHDLASYDGTEVPAGEEIWVLIGKGKADGMALIADEVDYIRRYHQSEIQPPPLSLRDRGESFAGVTDQGTLILNLDGLVQDEHFYYG